MGNFSITLDNKFDELISKNKNKSKFVISLKDLIELKSSLKLAYSNEFIGFSLSEIDFKI